jgi:EAL domain-containing protein (putative c-di-GMP-specific phosphodiesterase class I)
VYLPIVAPDGRIDGFEALCRWTTPELGEIPPTRFVLAAEASVLVLDLDRRVLGEATRQIAAWDRDGVPGGVYVAINMSAAQLSRLRAQGARVAVDDFGTGCTSISQLLHLPVDVIETDRSVAAMDLDRGRSLVRMMIDVARPAPRDRLPTEHVGIDTAAEAR